MRAWRCKPLHLEVIEAKFLFELLMGLLAQPPRLDGSGECSEGARRREVRQLILFARRSPDTRRRARPLRHLGGASASVLRRGQAFRLRRELASPRTSPERSFGAAPPWDGPPLLQLKRVVRR